MFFRIVKVITKIENKVKMVTGLLNDEGERLEFESAVGLIIKQLYCPKQGLLGNMVVETVASENIKV